MTTVTAVCTISACTVEKDNCVHCDTTSTEIMYILVNHSRISTHAREDHLCCRPIMPMHKHVQRVTTFVGAMHMLKIPHQCVYY